MRKSTIFGLFTFVFTCLFAFAAQALPAVHCSEKASARYMVVSPKYQHLGDSEVAKMNEVVKGFKTRTCLIVYQAGALPAQMDDFVEAMIKKWPRDIYNPATDLVAVVSNYPNWIRFFPPTDLRDTKDYVQVFSGLSGPRHLRAVEVLRQIDGAYQAQVSGEAEAAAARLVEENRAAEAAVLAEEQRILDLEVANSHYESEFAHLLALRDDIYRFFPEELARVDALLDEVKECRSSPLSLYQNAAKITRVANSYSQRVADRYDGNRLAKEGIVLVFLLALFPIGWYRRARDKWLDQYRRLVQAQQKLDELIVSLPKAEDFLPYADQKGRTRVLLDAVSSEASRQLVSLHATRSESKKIRLNEAEVRALEVKLYGLSLRADALIGEWKGLQGKIRDAQTLEWETRVDMKHEEIRSLNLSESLRELVREEQRRMKEVFSDIAKKLQNWDSVQFLDEFHKFQRDCDALPMRFGQLMSFLRNLEKSDSKKFDEVEGLLLREIAKGSSLDRVLMLIRRKLASSR